MFSIPSASRLLSGAVLTLSAMTASAAITVTMSAPAANATVTANQIVPVTVNVSGANFGIFQVTFTCEGDQNHLNQYTYNQSPPTNSTNITYNYIVPASISPGEALTINVTATGYADQPGSVTRDVIAAGTVVTPPGNNSFSAATTISGASSTISGTNAGATKETFEPNHASNIGGKSIWYSWTAPHSTQVTIDTFGCVVDTLLAVYTGNAINALTFVASNDQAPSSNQSLVTFTPTAGQTYKIAIDGYNNGSSTSSGSTVLNWSQAIPAAASDWNLYE